MKTANKLALLGALALGLSGWSLTAQDNGGTPPPDGPPPHHPGGPGGPHRPPPAIIGALDANHDGVIDADEIANASAALRTLDKNGDGKLTPDEFMGPPPGGPMAGGQMGGGKAGMAQMGPPKEILDKYDLNKDGKLDETERAALEKDIADGTFQPPARMGGPRGMRGPGAQGFGGGPAHTPPTAKQLLEKFDVNKDGVLDETELAAMVADMAAHRPHPPQGLPTPGGQPQDAPQQ
jgi:Ca2+-binding EF-hand superfamily protein